MTYRIAHLSDCHLGPLPPLRRVELFSKRLLGYINWRRNRSQAFVPGTIERLIDDLKVHTPDHVAVTGDLVNLGLEAEFINARVFLESLGEPHDVTAIPGNHDAYVPGALARFNHHCGPYLKSDTGTVTPTRYYPSVRRRGPVTLIGVSSATATGPFMATGSVSKAQRQDMERELVDASGTFRVVLIHHPPFENATRWHKRLEGARKVRAIWAKRGAELVLHGHTHVPTRTDVPGPNGPIPVFGVSSSAQAAGGKRPPASYTLFDIDENEEGWQVTAMRRGYPSEGGSVTELSREVFTIERP